MRRAFGGGGGDSEKKCHLQKTARDKKMGTKMSSFVTIRWVIQSCLYVLFPLEYARAINLVCVGYTFVFYSSVCSLIHVWYNMCRRNNVWVCEYLFRSNRSRFLEMLITIYNFKHLWQRTICNRSSSWKVQKGTIFWT